jgi:hypothetical protein
MIDDVFTPAFLLLLTATAYLQTRLQPALSKIDSPPRRFQGLDKSLEIRFRSGFGRTNVDRAKSSCAPSACGRAEWHAARLKYLRHPRDKSRKKFLSEKFATGCATPITPHDKERAAALAATRPCVFRSGAET